MRRDGADGEDRVDLADQRTEYAEDRTVMANERTFAGWIRTGLAAVGIGVAFHALFDQMEPHWLPRAIASSFIAAGMVVVVLAQRNARHVLNRLNAHAADPISGTRLTVVAGMVLAGALTLLVAIWWLV